MSVKFNKVEHIYSPDTTYSFYALKGIDLEINMGKMTAVIGHTGSGKSTMIQHINGLLKPTSGTVEINEYKITSDMKKQVLRPLRKEAGMVFQFPEYQLFEETVVKDIIFGPVNFGESEEEAIALAKKYIKKVGLDESFLEKSPFELSGGQKRRVAIAGILAMEPSILILDEPTAGLDPNGLNQMMNLFKDINNSGVTVIIVTHDMNCVYKYCDEAVVMNKGKVEKHVSVTELFKDVEYLSDMSIDLPIITQFINQLNENGFDIDTSIKDEQELAQRIGEILCRH